MKYAVNAIKIEEVVVVRINRKRDSSKNKCILYTVIPVIIIALQSLTLSINKILINEYPFIFFCKVGPPPMNGAMMTAMMLYMNGIV